MYRMTIQKSSLTPVFTFRQRRGAEGFRRLLPFRDNGDPVFICCENSRTKQPLAQVKLLKALDRRPDLLDEIKVV